MYSFVRTLKMIDIQRCSCYNWYCCCSLPSPLLYQRCGWCKTQTRRIEAKESTNRFECDRILALQFQAYNSPCEMRLCCTGVNLYTMRWHLLSSSLFILRVYVRVAPNYHNAKNKHHCLYWNLLFVWMSCFCSFFCRRIKFHEKKSVLVCLCLFFEHQSGYDQSLWVVSSMHMRWIKVICHAVQCWLAFALLCSLSLCSHKFLKAHAVSWNQDDFAIHKYHENMVPIEYLVLYRLWCMHVSSDKTVKKVKVGH